MSNRQKYISVIMLMAGVTMLVISLFIGLPLITKVENGVFTASECGSGSARSRVVSGVTCRGTFQPNNPEKVSDIDVQTSVRAPGGTESGEVIEASVSRGGALTTSQTIADLVPLIFGSAFAFWIAITFMRSAKSLPGSQESALTAGVSGWSHVAFFASIATLLLIPAPVALIAGTIALTTKSNSKGLWRAWVGVVIGLLGSLLLLRVALDFMV